MPITFSRKSVVPYMVWTSLDSQGPAPGPPPRRHPTEIHLIERIDLRRLYPIPSGSVWPQRAVLIPGTSPGPNRLILRPRTKTIPASAGSRKGPPTLGVGQLASHGHRFQVIQTRPGRPKLKLPKPAAESSEPNGGNIGGFHVTLGHECALES